MVANIPADGYILAEIGIKRREQAERSIHLPAEQTRYKCALSSNVIRRASSLISCIKAQTSGASGISPPFDKIEKFQKFHIQSVYSFESSINPEIVQKRAA